MPRFPRCHWIASRFTICCTAALLLQCTGSDPKPTAAERYREDPPHPVAAGGAAPSATPASQKEWGHVVRAINELDEKKATKAEWVAAAPLSHPIPDRRALGEVIAPLKLNENDHRTCQVRYLQNKEAMAFDFEGDHHALVFFDDEGKATHVMKW